MKKINPKFEYIAWVLVLFTFIVTIYYMVVLSWDLVYLVSSFTFDWGTNVANYFITNVGGSSNLNNTGSLLIPTTIGVLVVWFILWFISNKDGIKGLEKLPKYLYHYYS